MLTSIFFNIFIYFYNQIRSDIGTEVMKRSVQKGYLAGNNSTCIISIVSNDVKDPTLDFEIDQVNKHYFTLKFQNCIFLK